MIIPRDTYRQVESMLHRRAELLGAAQKALRDAQDRAYYPTAPAPDTDHVRTSPAGDRLERAALAVIEAERRVQAAHAWGKVFVLLDRDFYGTKEGEAAEMMYIRHYSQAKVAGQLHVNRQTARRLRDKYVVRAALYASEAGLISITKEAE